MNDVSTRERVGREAPLQRQVNWDVFFSPLAKRVVWDAKEGLKHVDILGHELLQDVSVDVLTAIAEADKRGWRVMRAKDRVGFYNDHHLAQKAPGEVFTSRNSFIKDTVRELRNLCGMLELAREGAKIDLMTRLAEHLELPMDEVALPAEQPAVIEPEPVTAPEPVKTTAPAPKADGIPTISPPPLSKDVIAVMLTCPYGRAKPLYRKDLFADKRYSEWKLIKGRTLENLTNVLIKTGTYRVTNGPGPHTDEEGKRWKCVVLQYAPRPF